MAGRSLAVIGAGWAGLAAAVRAVDAGWRVTVFEMAPQAGGRARALPQATGPTLDNGQHILIGAYRETLALMRRVGADPAQLFCRRPMTLLDARGQGLALPPGPAVPAFVRAVLDLRAWPLRDRLALLVAAARWRLGGFRAPTAMTVAQLIHGLPPPARTSLFEPLCVAALNTPAHEASAQVFLRVLRDALFSGPGAADLLLPRQPLSALLPEPAWRWLAARGATLHNGSRVQALRATAGGWTVDDTPFDGVVLATSAVEAARLARPFADAWAESATALRYEPIVTVYLHSPGTRLHAPMVALTENAQAPAQFVFDLGAIDGGGARDGLFACVVSGAKDWVAQGLDATARACVVQVRTSFASGTWSDDLRVARTVAEKRATFACTPGLRRPECLLAPGLVAAGDYVEGPYPATLEGAVRSAGQAVSLLGSGNA